MAFLTVHLAVVVTVMVSAIAEIKNENSTRKFWKRIVGGFEVDQAQLPWMVYILKEYPDVPNSKPTLCGGALIAPNLVITAAHCLTFKQLSRKKGKIVRMPYYDLKNIWIYVGSSKNDIARHVPAAKVFVKQIFMVQGAFLSSNDIGIILLAENLECDIGLNFVKLPTIPRKYLPKDVQCVVAGWGHINKEATRMPGHQLHAAWVKMIHRKNCVEAYEKKTERLDESQFCAGDWEDGNVDSCLGDSGGPLVCKVKNSWAIYGVISSGPKPCGVPGKPGLYTDVYSHISMIQSIAAQGAGLNFMEWFNTLEDCHRKFSKNFLDIAVNS